ncbi:transport and Golgi organization protein 2 [Coccinella septempunctata]|uniref:transport and Golgi organization protein 2 n=1 Tax=Coccinella septempunctata TaxID=41139 RepID=UPI001D094EC1|nr:transport and Golgi organization protein 2 [Coccinella septempunctata]
MCIVFIKTNPNPKNGEYRLIIASNRDEFYKRPAKKAFLCTDSKIIGGRDLEENRENGMWLGLRIDEKKQTLRFGSLLNVTGEEKNTNVQSRGFIVPNYLKAKESTVQYFENLLKNAEFNAFNLVAVELNKKEVSVYFLSNTPIQICKFHGEQTLGFGNSPVNRPLTKVRNGRHRFEDVVQTSKSKEELKDGLLKLLKSNERNLPDPELQRRAPQAYEQLSSIYVEIKKTYGTRTHSIVLVDKDWNVEFYEDTMESPINPDNIVWGNSVIKSSL